MTRKTTTPSKNHSKEVLTIIIASIHLILITQQCSAFVPINQHQAHTIDLEDKTNSAAAASPSSLSLLSTSQTLGNTEKSRIINTRQPPPNIASTRRITSSVVTTTSLTTTTAGNLAAFWWSGDDTPEDGGGGGGGGGESSKQGRRRRRRRSRRRQRRREKRGDAGKSSGDKSPSAQFYVDEDFASSALLEPLEISSPSRLSDVVTVSSPKSSTTTTTTTTTTAAARMIENAAESFLLRRATHVKNLCVSTKEVDYKGNSNIKPLLNSATPLSSKNQHNPPTLAPLLFRGEVGSIHATFNEIAFPPIQCSGGGTIGALGLKVNLRTFLSRMGQAPATTPEEMEALREKYKDGPRRFLEPFELYAMDCLLTREDVKESRCIRNGLQVLLNRILRRVLKERRLESAVLSGMEVQVHAVDILDNKLSCTGIAKPSNPLLSRAEIPFEVRTGLSTSCRGHVLEFPGIEMILNPGNKNNNFEVVLPIHRWQDVNVDLGNDAKIDKIHIDDTVLVGLRATVAKGERCHDNDEEGLFDVSRYRQRKDAFGAKYSIDLGEWFTNLWNLNH